MTKLRLFSFALIVLFLVACNTLVGESDEIPIFTEGATQAIQVLRLEVEPTNPERGGTITVTWEVIGVESVSIRLEGAEYRSPEYFGLELPPSGTETFTLPIHDYFAEGGTLHLSSNQGGAEASVGIRIQCPFTVMSAEQRCPMAEKQVEATYQPFEHGMIVWLNDEIYPGFIMHDEGYILLPGLEGSAPNEAPPAGLFAAEGALAELWNRHGENPNGPLIRDSIGWATAPSQSYTAQVQVGPFLRDVVKVYVRLPDERIVEIHVFFGRPVTWRTVE
jgi:hypothetical protein